ncbi:MAG: sulfatase [Planctomycetota bacterium]
MVKPLLATARGRRILRSLLPAVAALAAACDGNESPRADTVVLISIDTLRPDHLGCYGHDRPTSPAIDALAASGVRFTDVAASSPWTLPSHASLLTGMYPSRHGVKDVVNTLRDGVPTLAGLLRERGWRTRAVVNSINVAARYGLGTGFDSFAEVSEWVDPRNPAAGSRNAGGEVTDRGLRWLREAGDAPLFLFLHYYDVHTDYTPAPEYRERFVGPYAGPVDGTTRQLLAFRSRRAPLSAADVDHLRQLYDAEIAELDDQLARLFAYLEESGRSERALVVLTSDHGEEFLEHGSLLHGRTHFQELLAIPLVLAGPGVPAGRTYDAPSGLVDVAPTILGLLGLPVPEEVDGVDLSFAWRNPVRLPAERLLFSEADHNNAQPDIGRSIRLARHKLILDRPTDRALLFDLAVDPGERTDLAAREPRRAALLREALASFLAGERPGSAIEGPDEELAAKLRAAGYADLR